MGSLFFIGHLGKVSMRRWHWNKCEFIYIHSDYMPGTYEYIFMNCTLKTYCSIRHKAHIVFRCINLLIKLYIAVFLNSEQESDVYILFQKPYGSRWYYILFNKLHFCAKFFSLVSYYSSGENTAHSLKISRCYTISFADLKQT